MQRFPLVRPGLPYGRARASAAIHGQVGQMVLELKWLGCPLLRGRPFGSEPEQAMAAIKGYW
jgi:hypothetical protein